MGRRKKILTEEEIKAKQQKEEDKKNGVKKRGRKPKNKIHQVIEVPKIKKLDTNIVYQNIILHLKCNSKDISNNNRTNNILDYDPNVNDIKPFEEENNYYDFNNHDNNIDKETDKNNIPLPCNDIETINDSSTSSSLKSINSNQNKIISEKINDLQLKLHHNNINKKSNCFWCTYDFDNPVIYIPKFIKNNSYHVYGNFCSPECACSFLFNEHIDDSCKFERYQLLNYMYCNVYDYKKNIKLAPNPYYTLDKYMGNLSIQEYRKLLNNERLLILIDKPLTKIFPELHEDNNEHEVGVNNKYSLKRTSKINKEESVKNLFTM
tara:strand:- start:12 stop:974 length:963 start_codon:yes stop_codon:yes gene_type:complete